jgi:hypothetical protein
MTTKTNTAVGFPDDGDETQVQNVSGTPGFTPPGFPSPPRGIDDLVPPGRRRQVQITAQSGEALDARTAGALRAHAARQADQQHYDWQRDIRPAAYLDHVFGVNLGRA